MFEGAAIALGFVGSLHCVTMCGPIALSLSAQTNRLGFILTRLFYNLGRVTTYAFLGLLIGTIGESARLLGLQQGLSIAIGAILILSVLLTRVRFTINPLNSLYLRFKGYFSAFIKSKSVSRNYALGLINGLLPCGLVYLAMLGSLGTASLSGGILFMTFFGLGTIPSLLVVAVAGKVAKPAFTRQVSSLAPALTVILACLLILRGLNLGIPYISPNLVISTIPIVTECAIP